MHLISTLSRYSSVGAAVVLTASGAWAQGAGEAAISAALPRVSGAGMHEMSPWSMFMGADMIVKVVMVGLAFASVVTWTVFIAKSVEIWAGEATRAAKPQADRQCADAQ